MPFRFVTKNIFCSSGVMDVNDVPDYHCLSISPSVQCSFVVLLKALLQFIDIDQLHCGGSFKNFALDFFESGYKIL